MHEGLTGRTHKADFQGCMGTMQDIALQMQKINDFLHLFDYCLSPSQPARLRHFSDVMRK